MDDLRIRLIERICRLADAQLPLVESFLNDLARGNESPGCPLPATKVATIASSAALARPAMPEDALRPTGPAPLGAKDWPHAPVHRISEHGTFIVTAATLNQQHLFRGGDKLTLLESALLRLARQYEVTLEAWAVFSNHYHFVAHTSGVTNQLANLIADFHNRTANDINRLDGATGRRVWFNFWETALTFEKSYFARLNYVHHNAVKHGLVPVANQYRWCSAAWFEQSATPAQIKTIYGFKYDRLKIEDDYQPIL